MVMYIDDVDEPVNFRDALWREFCRAVYTTTPFYPSEIETAWERCHSWDVIFEACVYASEHGDMDDLAPAMDAVLGKADRPSPSLDPEGFLND